MVSFYRGSAHVSLKESIFHPSNAERHAVELINLLESVTAENSAPSPVLFVMTYDGPDHNCNHLSVQMSWLGFFLKTRMDMLVVIRVAPTQSWTNPAERCMGDPINLALQNYALSRTKLKEDTMEVHMRRCNGMSSVRTKAEEFTVTASVVANVDQEQAPLTGTPRLRSTREEVSREPDLQDSDMLGSPVLDGLRQTGDVVDVYSSHPVTCILDGSELDESTSACP